MTNTDDLYSLLFRSVVSGTARVEESTFERESEMFMPPGYPRALGPARWQAHMRVFIPYAVRDMPEITDYPPLREDVRRLAEKYGVRAVQAMVTQLALEADRG